MVHVTRLLRPSSINSLEQVNNLLLITLIRCPQIIPKLLIFPFNPIRGLWSVSCIITSTQIQHIGHHRRQRLNFQWVFIPLTANHLSPTCPSDLKILLNHRYILLVFIFIKSRITRPHVIKTLKKRTLDSSEELGRWSSSTVGFRIKERGIETHFPSRNCKTQSEEDPQVRSISSHKAPASRHFAAPMDKLTWGAVVSEIARVLEFSIFPTFSLVDSSGLLTTSWIFCGCQILLGLSVGVGCLTLLGLNIGLGFGLIDVVPLDMDGPRDLMPMLTFEATNCCI
jgi:hypothetical protein